MLGKNLNIDFPVTRNPESKSKFRKESEIVLEVLEHGFSVFSDTGACKRV